MRLWDPGAIARSGSRLRVYARLVRIEHTLFSLPFATIGLLVARAVDIRVYILAFLSLLGLRIAAMSFNNLADADIDALNPRTSRRPVVAGIVSGSEALLLTLAGLALFYLAAYVICPQALYYATPLAILALSYPFAKRVHHLPHLHLGLVLGLSVFGGWVAGECSRNHCVSLAELLVSAPWAIILGVALWVAGFDIIYSVMDYEFDRRLGVRSIPALLGPEVSLRAALALEVLATILWALGGYRSMGVYALYSSMAAGMLAVAAVGLANARRELIPEAFKMNLAVGFIALPGYIAALVV